MAGGTVVAEQCPSRLTHNVHQARIGLDGRIAIGLDLLRPLIAAKRGLFQGFLHIPPIIKTQQSLCVCHANRPSGHQYPIAEGEQRGQNQKEIDRAGDWRIQLLDAVPFMPGGHVPGMKIAFLYRHGLSSSRKMEVAARSKPFLFDGQYA